MRNLTGDPDATDFVPDSWPGRAQARARRVPAVIRVPIVIAAVGAPTILTIYWSLTETDHSLFRFLRAQAAILFSHYFTGTDSPGDVVCVAVRVHRACGVAGSSSRDILSQERAINRNA
jgi:hypothetical protein